MASKTKAVSFTRTSFLTAATTLLEDVMPSGPLGLGDIPIRELTAAQRLEAVEVAKVYDSEGEEVTLPDGSTKLDLAKYYAAIIVSGVLDPATCFDDKGTFIEGQGSLLLQPDDIFTLAERGKEVLQDRAQYILRLSWMTKDAMFRNNQENDDRESPTGAGAGDSQSGTPA